MTAAVLLDRLQGVKERAPGSWVAKCPAHQDRAPSLSIRQTGDGVVLIRCFAGCQVGDIVGAVGLNLSDLFPPRTSHGKPAKRPPILSGDVLRALEQDLLIIAQGTRLMLAGGLFRDEVTALAKATDHIIDLVEAARHG